MKDLKMKSELKPQPKTESKSETLISTIRHSLFDYMMPTYFLDEGFYIIAWNPAFEQIFGKPMGLKIGQHAAEFVGRWENSKEALARSAKVFSIGKVPVVDHEPVELKHKKYGLVRAQKMAIQVHHESEMGWIVTYVLRDCEKFDQIMDDLMNGFAQRVQDLQSLKK